MNSSPFNWPSLIGEMADESIGIAPDVTFKIVENDNTQELKAHKMILGMVSPMFRKMFFTTEVGDKSSKEIVIKETTPESFQIMINAIYGTRSLEDSLKGKSVAEVFDVINLIERYQISELQEIADKHLSNYPVTDDTVLEVAAEALEYTKLFQKEAQNILGTCAKFLQPKLRDASSILRYLTENEDRKEVVSTLLIKINKMNEDPVINRISVCSLDYPGGKCSNCNYEKKNCRNGKEVEEDEFREGLLVTNNRARNAGWSRYDAGIAKVITVTPTQIAMTTIKNGVTDNWSDLTAAHFPEGRLFNKVYNWVPFFQFSCN